MALDALHWHTPASMLLGFPLSYTEVTSIPLRGCGTMPLCHVHSFFDIFAFCSHFLKDSRMSPPYFLQFWAVVKPCAFLCPPLSCQLDTDLHPSSQCRTVSFASNLLPRRSFWQTHFVFFRKRASPGSSHAPSFNSSCSYFAAHFFQYTDRALYQHLFNVPWAHMPDVNFLSRH